MGNYIDFFHTVAAEASYLQYCIMEPYINEVITVTRDCIHFLIFCSHFIMSGFVACLFHLCLLLSFICIELSSNEASFVIVVTIIKNTLKGMFMMAKTRKDL